MQRLVRLGSSECWIWLWLGAAEPSGFPSRWCGVLHGVDLLLVNQAFWLMEGNDPRIEVRVGLARSRTGHSMTLSDIGAIEHFARPGFKEQAEL